MSANDFFLIYAYSRHKHFYYKLIKKALIKGKIVPYLCP